MTEDEEIYVCRACGREDSRGEESLLNCMSCSHSERVVFGAV